MRYISANQWAGARVAIYFVSDIGNLPLQCDLRPDFCLDLMFPTALCRPRHAGNEGTGMLAAYIQCMF